MKYFEGRITYPQFLKYLVPSVLTMIFLSFYTTIDGFFVSKYAAVSYTHLDVYKRQAFSGCWV